MTLRGLSLWSCTAWTGVEQTWCALAWEHRQRPAAWLWCRFVGIPHCIEQHGCFYRRQPYTETEPMFPWWPRFRLSAAHDTQPNLSIIFGPILYSSAAFL